MIAIGRRKRLGNALVLYAWMAAAGFILLSVFFKWNHFSGRFHLPFFLLIAPLAGVVLSSFPRLRLEYPAAALLFVACLPWLLSLDSRPILPIAGRSKAGSILSTPREQLYFANAGSVDEPYHEIAAEIRQAGCNQVGLMLLGDDPEYLLWHVLGAPRQDLTIDWIVSGVTKPYRIPGFQPCAVVCRNCSEARLNGLDLAREWTDQDLRLYMKEAVSR